jgi:hypothetical protein
MSIIGSTTTITNFERTDLSATDKFFNNYFSSELNVPLGVNDALLSYFEKITDNRESAAALASAVINTSAAQQLDFMEVLEQFSKMQKNELNSYLCMFLNINRVNTSLLGINNNPIRNRYVERAIRP